MSLEQEINIVQESWAKNPIPEDFKSINANKLMCSLEGIQQQIDNLPSGEGQIRVAVVNENALNSIEIKIFKVFKTL